MELLQLNSPNLKVAYLQVDFSFALMSAVLMSLEFGSLAQYFDILVDESNDRRHGRSRFFVLNVCRVHSTKFLYKNIERHYKEYPECQEYLKQWAHALPAWS